MEHEELIAELVGALSELVRQVERPNSEWDNIRIAAEKGRKALARAEAALGMGG